MPSFTLKLPPARQDELRGFFLEHGFESRDAPHAFWQMRGPGCNATFYTSGKLLIQGKEADAWRGLLGDEHPEARPFQRALSKHPNPPPKVWIGTDEAGKGDYFGPLVVAGVALPRDRLEILQTLGVDDSKSLTDKKINEMVQGIEACCETEVLVIMPRRYNELYAKIGNLNRMLAWAHGKVIENLLEKAPEVQWALVDQFAKGDTLRRNLGERGRQITVAERTKAEEDPAVGAASVLARAAYLRALAGISRRCGVKLGPGAGPPTLARGRELVAMSGPDVLGEVGKLHFATTRQITG